MTTQRKPKKTWGNWTLCRSTYSLSYKRGFYVIDLNRCRNSSQILDWIQHISGKTFIRQDPESMLDLVRALKDLLQLPTGYCEWGNPGETSVDIKSRVNGIDKRHEEFERISARHARFWKRQELRYRESRQAEERG